MRRDSKIFIAGHTGLVGSAITKILTGKGYSELILKQYEELNLTDQNAVDEFFAKERPEYVFIAAAKVGGIIANNTLRADFIYNNILIQSNIIYSSWKYGIKKLLFLGSTCVYPKNAPQPLTEDSLLTSSLEYTNEPYAIAKIAGIKMCESFNIQYKTNFISVMPTNLYGTGDNFDLRNSHVLPALLRKLHLGKCLEENNWNMIRKDLDKYPIDGITGKAEKEDIKMILKKHGILLKKEDTDRNEVIVTIWGTGNPLREFMYSEDLAEACVFIMEKIGIKDIISIHSLGKYDPDYHAPHFLNIGTGEEISIKDLAERIKALVNFRGNIVFDNSKPDGTPQKIADAEILHRLGYQHKVGLKEGLIITYNEYLKYM